MSSSCFWRMSCCAIATRWRWPPEICAGKNPMRCSRPKRASSILPLSVASARDKPLAIPATIMLPRTVVMAQQRVVLEDDADVAGAQRLPLDAGDAPAVGAIETGDEADEPRLAGRPTARAAPPPDR